MPSSYKDAILTPILKKPDLNTEDLKNYRPISNLSYVSKLIEKVVAKQITNYVSTNNFDEPMQSAFRYDRPSDTTSKTSTSFWNYCLHWIKSYLDGRKLRVAIDGILYASKALNFGVPQGSVLGPKLFKMYLVPLGDIARIHGVTFHAYADDCQPYIAFSRENVSMAKYKMETVLAEIKQWMSTNMLKLNDSKSEIIAVGEPRRNLMELQSLTVGNEGS